MTAREKLRLEHPEITDGQCYSQDGAYCPSDFGYLKVPEGSCFSTDCKECWDREIPEEKEEKNMIYAHIGPDLATVDPKEVQETYKHVEEGKMTVNEMRETLGLPKILDSGNRRQFESGAVRDIQEGKGRCDLLPLDVVADIYEEFYSYDHPDISEVFDRISQFRDTGDAKHLYYALDNFECFEAWSNMFLQVAIHFEEGAKKYGENNWQKGIPVHCYIDSAVRHYLKFLRGDKDEPHDRAFCWNILCAIWTCKHKPGLNEYAKEKPDPMDNVPKKGFNPVAIAYSIAKDAIMGGDGSNMAIALEEIVGYLGEALE